MVHRFSFLRPARLHRVWRGLVLVSSAIAVCHPASSGAAELLRSPGWLAVMPDDSQPVVPEVRAKGREWFVDANKGDDGGSGSQASPWKTLGRLKRAGLASGDVVRLRCGSVWREVLQIDGRSWPSDVTLASDGVCAAGSVPSIRGSDVVSSAWQSDGPQSGVSMVDRFGACSAVFFKGEHMTPARMPDGRGTGQEFLLADGQNSPRTFRLRERERRLVGDRDLVGATVYVRVVAWQVEKAAVRAYDAASGVVTLDKDLSSRILTGAGYILEGKRWMLDTPGEWFHDDTAKRLYLMAPGRQRPQSGDVEVVARENALRVKGVKQLRIVGLDIRQTSQVALWAGDSSDLTLEGLNFTDPGEYAVVIDQTSGFKLRGSHVRGAGWASIMTRNTSDASIEGNRVFDSGLNGRAFGSSAAIIANGERNVVSRNLIIRSANAGINFANKQGNLVSDNLVLQPCLRMTDCGGIYTWTGHAPSLAMRKRASRATVKGNVVLGVGGNLEGAGGRGRNMAMGIYLDEMSGGVSVQDNLVAGMEVGLYLHNAQFNDLLRNTVRAVSHASVMASNTLPDANVILGNRIRGNSLTAKPPAPGKEEVFAYKWLKRADPDGLFAGDDANEVQGNDIVKAGVDGQTRWIVGSGLATQVLSPGAWKRFAGSEREKALGLPPEAARQHKQQGAPLLAEGDFRMGASGWSAYFNPAGTGGKANPTTCSGIPCMRLVAGHPSDALSSKGFRMDARPGNNHHLLKYTVEAGPQGATVRATVRRNGPPYDGFGLEQAPVKVEPGQVIQVELPFEAVSDDPARVDFSVEPGREILLSKVSLSRVDANTAQQVTVGRALLLINLSDEVRSLSCADTRLSDCSVIDEQGREATWPVKLAPGARLTVYPKQRVN